MKIVEALKNDDRYIIVTTGERRLFWECGEWWVSGAHNRVYYRGSKEQDAVAALCDENTFATDQPA